MVVYFIRHSRPLIEPGICYGHLNIDVAESFKTDVQNLIEKFLKIRKVKCYSSPSIRCSKLAREIFGETIATDPRWMELNFGIWEGKAWNTLSGMEYNNWTNDFVETQCPNGESYKELFSRATNAFEDLLTAGNENSVVITHAGVIRSVIAYLLQIPLENSFTIHLDYAGVTKVKLNQGIFSIQYINRLY